MVIKQISVFVENKPGRLAEITGILSQKKIDIRAFSIADTADFGILRLIVNDPSSAVAALKEAGMTVSLTNVVAVALDDQPGGLYSILSMLSQAGITVEYAYAFITRKDMGAYVILRLENLDTSIELMQKNGVQLLTAEDVYSL